MIIMAVNSRYNRTLKTDKDSQLEDELLEAANQLNVGPMGLHGKTTALKIQIEQFPTHIAGLPCAVNICCHVCRHARMVI